MDRVRRSGRSYAGQEFEVAFFSDAKFDATDFAALVPNQDVSAGRRGLRTGLSLHRAFIHGNKARDPRSNPKPMNGAIHSQFEGSMALC